MSCFIIIYFDKLPLWASLWNQNKDFREFTIVPQFIITQCEQGKQQKVENITTVIFTNFRQVSIVDCDLPL